MDINIESTCRTCLKDTVNSRRSLFDKMETNEITFSEMLLSCVGLNISRDDSFSTLICNVCSLKLHSAWEFIEMCKNSQDLLQKHYNDHKSSNISNLLDVKVKIEEEFDSSIVEYDSVSDKGDQLMDAVCYKWDANDSTSEKEFNKFKRKKRKTKKIFKNSDWKCDSCSHSAATKCALKKHIKLHHPEIAPEVYPCSECKKIFKRKSDRIVHMRSHSGERPFTCKYCPQSFAQSGTLILHTRRLHTGETPFRCPSCPRLFACHSSLQRHIRTHSTERPYACDRCGATFAQPSCLSQHAQVHTTDRVHACSTCGRRLKTLLGLRNHQLTHGEKGFVCEHCGKEFFIKANLDKHRKKMHGKQAGVCSVCFKPCSDLVRHSEIHAELPLLRCSQCPRFFRTSATLSYHQTTTHDNARKFKCQVEKCTRAFPKQSMLDFHTRKMHSNETPYSCDLCSCAFFRKSDLSRHINTVHPNEKCSK